MNKIRFDLPTMYGDHHVSEVRRILLEMPGVEEVYASSAFRVVEVTCDPEKINESIIENALESAGYLGEWPVVTETRSVTPQNGTGNVFRHTAIYEQTQKVVSFAQEVNVSGRPLWPCPGLGVISGMDEE